MSMKQGIAKGAVVAGLGIAIVMGAGSVPAYAASPSIDGTPANPVVTVDQSHAYAPGDEVTIDVSQTVGKEKYDEFVLSDVISTGVLDITNKPAHVYKVSADGKRSEVNGAGTYTYDKKTKTLAFSFSKDYLDHKMESDGSTTYVLEYTLRVTDADGIRKAAGGASGIDLDVSAASTIAVDGHDAYSKGATWRTIAIDADAKGKTHDDAAFDPMSYISSLVENLFADHSSDYGMVSTSGTDASVRQASEYKSHVALVQVAEDNTTDTNESTGTDAANGNTQGTDATTANGTTDGTTGTSTTDGGKTTGTGASGNDATNTATNTSSDTGNTGNDVTTPSGNGNTGTDAPSVDASPSVTLSLKDGSVEPGGKTTGKLTISAASGKVLGNTDYALTAPSGVTISDEQATPDSSANPKTVTVTFTATVDGTKDVAGKTLTVTGGTKDGTVTKSANITVRQPAVSGTLTADKEKMETGETVTFTSTASAVKDGTGTAPTVTGVVRTMTLSVPEGATVTASDNGTVKQEGTNVSVTWAAESGDGALATHTVKVAVPDTAETGGKSVTATGTITGTNIADTTLGGNPTVDITPNTAGVAITPDKETVDAGDTLTFKIDASKLTGHLKNAKLNVQFSEISSSVSSNGETGMGIATREPNLLSRLRAVYEKDGQPNDNDGSVTYDLGTLTSSATKTITITIPDKLRGDDASQQSASGGSTHHSLSVNATITSDTSKDVSSDYDILEHVSSPTVSGTTTVSNDTPSAGDTVDVVVTPQVDNGSAKNLVTQVTLSDVGGATVTADGGGKVDGNVVTFPAVASASGKLDPQTIHITFPDNGTMNGRKITATATVSASNVQATQVGTQMFEVQTPSVSLKTSATAVSSKAAVDGKTSASDGGTTKASDVTDASSNAQADTPSDDASKQTTDGKGGDDTAPTTNPQEKKDANLVINNGDEIEYNIAVTQGATHAHANNVEVTSALDDYAAKNGVYIEPDTIVVKNGDTDITDQVTIGLNGSKTQPSGVTVGLGNINAGTITITYKASTGKASNDLMRGKKITNTTTLTGTNFSQPDDASVEVEIASAKLTPTMYTNASEVKIGTDVKYTTIITNNNNDDSTSIAKNVYVASAIDSYAASIGVAIDPSSLQILYVEDGKVQDVTKDVTIQWDGTQGFSVDTSVNLAATHTSEDDIKKAGNSTDDANTRYADLDHALVVLYSANTTDVSKDVYGENDVTSTVITRADNATYAAANMKTTLVAYDEPAQEMAQGGTIQDTLTQTGDPTVIAGIGTAIAAGFAGIVAAIRRRRR